MTQDPSAADPLNDRAAPSVEIVVVSYKSRHQLEAMLQVLRPEDNVVIADNSAGFDHVEDLVADRPGGRYLDAGGNGFAKAANLAARTSNADILIFANPDSRPTHEVWEALIADLVADPKLGASAASMLDHRGRIQMGVGGWEPSVGRAIVYSFGLQKILRRSGLYAQPRIGESIDVDWLTGACLATPRAVFASVGGFDERYFVYNEDVAYGRALREAGFRQRLRTDLLVPHFDGGSGAGSVQMWRMRGASFARYLLDHHERLAAQAMRVILAAGMTGRALLNVFLARRARARLFWGYVLGVVTMRAHVNT